MEVNLIVEALKFLVLGMSTVFMFLALMVVVLSIQAKIIMKYFPPKEETLTATGYASQEVSKKNNFSVVAAIAASLKSHNQSK